MENALYNILLDLFAFTTFCTLFNDGFYFFFSYSSVSGGFIAKYLMKSS
jgi:hypothetical protein